MNLWVIDSDSGVNLLYKSFMVAVTDEDIVSGFLTAFHHFSMEEFKKSLDSIEMGGLRWVYQLRPKYTLLFVAADTKKISTIVLKKRLNVIQNAFIKKFKTVFVKKGNNWDINTMVYTPFLKDIENYYYQWEQIENLTPLANFFDVLVVF